MPDQRERAVEPRCGQRPRCRLLELGDVPEVAGAQPSERLRHRLRPPDLAINRNGQPPRVTNRGVLDKLLTRLISAVDERPREQQ